jgi:hypothetical protein
MYYLGKYRTTQRPRGCVRCGQNAYYYHDDWDWVCASHLLDLVNIGGLAFDWEDYPEIWARTERLLQREPKKSSTVKNVDVDTSNAALWEDPLDGLNWEGTDE